jgi:DNA polymerase I
MAEKIEKQTSYEAELYNVDVRQDQRYLAEKDLFPCGGRDESRFSPDFEVPLIGLGLEVAGDPNLPRDISCVQVNGSKERFEGPEKVILADLLEFMAQHHQQASDKENEEWS